MVIASNGNFYVIGYLNTVPVGSYPSVVSLVANFEVKSQTELQMRVGNVAKGQDE